MTTRRKAAPGANRAASENNDHGSNSNATAQKIGKSPYGPDFVQISAEDAMQRICNGTPGIVVVQFLHDDRCRTLMTGRGDDCNCNPDEAFWSNVATGGAT
jgi:hypothetical protein